MKQNKTKQYNTILYYTKQNKTKRNKAKQNNTKQNKGLRIYVRSSYLFSHIASRFNYFWIAGITKKTWYWRWQGYHKYHKYQKYQGNPDS